MSAVLKFFADQRIAYIGPEAYRHERLVNKWDGIHTEVHELFDDGLTYPNHCMSLYLQHDARAWGQMEDLFRRTKLQGKTPKTIWKKEEYFRKGFWKVIHDNPDLAKIEKENDFKDATPWDKQFRVDSSLCSWWLQYYFDQYDPEMNVQVQLYHVAEDYAEIIRNAQMLEKKTHGIAEMPFKWTIPHSEINLDVNARGEISLKFEWDTLNNSSEMMGRFDDWGWTARDGTHYDHSKPALKRLRKMFPHVSFTIMDTPTNLYGDHNDWFYIYFEWQPKHFSWAQVKKAENAMKQLVIPHLGTFRPHTTPKEYHVVTLKF